MTEIKGLDAPSENFLRGDVDDETLCEAASGETRSLDDVRLRAPIEPYLLNLYELYARWGQKYMDENEVEVDYDELEEKFVIGTPEQRIEQLRTYEDLGVDHVVLWCQFPGQPQESAVRCLERLGDEVLPAFN